LDSKDRALPTIVMLVLKFPHLILIQQVMLNLLNIQMDSLAMKILSSRGNKVAPYLKTNIPYLKAHDHHSIKANPTLEATFLAFSSVSQIFLIH
jgi:hypothetical protein